MNDSLCGCCQQIFDNGDFDPPVNWEDWDEYKRSSAVIADMPHHSSIEELRHCAEADCILCKALWLQFPPQFADIWLTEFAEETEVIDKTEVFLMNGTSYANTQLFYSVEMSTAGTPKITVAVYNSNIRKIRNHLGLSGLLRIELDLCRTNTPIQLILDYEYCYARS
jgi:hypothetical protein